MTENKIQDQINDINRKLDIVLEEIYVQKSARESASDLLDDFLQDATPIFHQVGLDAINKINELDQKGYIDFFKEMSNVFDNIVTHFSKEDIRDLADNVVTILSTIKSMTQPDMLLAMNNAITVYKNLETTNIPEYSVWKAMKELRTPEMKRGLGFMISFLKNLSKEETKNEQLQ